MTPLDSPARGTVFLLVVGRRWLVDDDTHLAKGCHQVGQVLVGLLDDPLRELSGLNLVGGKVGVVVQPSRDVGLRRDSRMSGVTDDDLP